MLNSFRKESSLFVLKSFWVSFFRLILNFLFIIPAHLFVDSAPFNAFLLFYWLEPALPRIFLFQIRIYQTHIYLIFFLKATPTAMWACVPGSATRTRTNLNPRSWPWARTSGPSSGPRPPESPSSSSTAPSPPPPWHSSRKTTGSRKWGEDFTSLRLCVERAELYFTIF